MAALFQEIWSQPYLVPRGPKGGSKSTELDSQDVWCERHEWNLAPDYDLVRQYEKDEELYRH